MNSFLTGVTSCFPEAVINNDFFGDNLKSNKNVMFLGTKERRHMGRDDTASTIMSKAIIRLLEEHNIKPSEIDMITTNVSVPDELFNGCGAVIAKKIGASPSIVYDLHNTGCVSFVYMLDLVNIMMAAKGVKYALICNAQTAGGRIFAQDEVRTKAQAAIPGDGCGIALVSYQQGHEVLAFETKTLEANSEDMFISFDDGRKYWEPGNASGYIDFNEGKTAKIISRGNKLVPQVIRDVCTKAGYKTTDINLLITNQPNRHFLRNWREAVQLVEEQHHDTFDEFANLFGAGIPVSLDDAIQKKKIAKGDLVCLAGFSHAGDYAAASLIRW